MKLIPLFLALFFISSISTNTPRRVEIFSRDGTTPPITMTVSQEYIDKHLFGNTEVSFADITDNEEIITPSNALVYPARPAHQTFVNELTRRVQKQQVINYLEKLTSFPHRMSRRQGSQESSLWLKETAEKIISGLPESRRSLFSVELVKIPNYVADSVIITIKGKVPSNREDSNGNVIIGAHCDDVGNDRAGADDNGSGTVSVMEAFRVIAESNFIPERTVRFMYYSAEESGLIGSNVIANKYRSSGEKVYASLNTDMVGNVNQGSPLRGYVVKTSTTATLTGFLEKLITEYSRVPISPYNQSYGSDHISWFRAGFPSACWKEFDFSPHWHRTTDKTQFINYDLITEFVKVHIAFVVELSLARV